MTLALLPPDQRQAVLSLAAATVKLRSAGRARRAWQTIARPEQLPPPGDWRTWLILAGRGWGKTRTGAETVNAWVQSGQARRVAVVAQTAADVRDISMAALREAAGPTAAYSPSKHHLLTWPNGATAMGFSAEEPDSLRGYQFDSAWSDELAAWRYPETWDQLQFSLRVGQTRQIVTTTPRPVRLVRELLASPTVAVTRGRTEDNLPNLSEAFFRDIVSRYAGTRLGRQELDAEVLDDVPGALWRRAMFDERRPAPDLVRVVVAIDPAVTSGEDSDETGIIVAGAGVDGRGYVLADRSCRLSPDGWARRAVAAYHDFAADLVVAEDNNGGEMVALTLRMVDEDVPVRRVHASRGKRTRAEPVSALYEQGRITHVERFDDLEDQLCNWTPESGESPDRLDALVWALTELMVDDHEPGFLVEMRRLAGAA